MVLRNFDEIEIIESSQSLIITKKINLNVLSNLVNIACLKFFIDLNGKIIGYVLDFERGRLYLVDQNKEQLEALEDIYISI